MSNLLIGGKAEKKVKKDKKTKTDKKKVKVSKTTKKVNPWLVHVKETMKKNPDKKFKDILVIAKKTYKK